MQSIGHSGRCNCTSQYKAASVSVLFKYTYLLAKLGTVCLFCFLKNVHSDQAVRGEVIDKRGRSVLAGTTVRIVGIGKSVRTDVDGTFQFDAVPEGQHTFLFSKIGYAPFEQVVDLNTAPPYIYVELERALPLQLETIRIYGGSYRALRQFEETTDVVLNQVDLQKRLGMTLAGTLADEAGITERTMGRAVARPIIRGLGGDRLLILENGERVGDKSASSADHAVSIDPTAAEGVEITRGPASLLYGSSTLGGVINVKNRNIPQGLPEQPDVRLMFQSESVNSGVTAATRVTIPIGDFAGNFGWNRRLAADTHTPTGTIQNTAVSNVNFSTGASLIKPWGFIGAAASRYRSDYGIPGSPEGHINGVNITLDRHRYDAQMAYQLNRPWLDKLKLQTAYTSYEHQELESNGALGVEFGLLTYNLSATAYLFENAIAGAWAEYRDHATGGFYWTPHTREAALAVFYLNQHNFDKLTLQGALRCDVRRTEPFHPGSVIRAGTVRRRDFNGISGAAAGIYHWTEKFSTGTTLMKTFRAPGVEELFSDGPHLAVYSYEIGNAELGSENGYGTEIFARYVGDRFNINLTVFRNQINNYLTPSNTGEKEWGSGAAGWLWIYQYMGHDVVMDGAETQIDSQLLTNLHLQCSISYVNGTIEASGQPLERMPPLKGKLVFRYTSSPVQLHVTSRFSGGQTRVGEFEEPTAGYLVYDIGGDLNFSWGQLENVMVVEVENIFDTVYRSHLSRIKSVMPEPGRNVKFLYKLNF